MGPSSEASCPAEPPSSGLLTAGTALLLFCAIASTSPALGQACPAPAIVSGTSCTVPPGSTVPVNSAGAAGHDASNPGSQITADGVAVTLGAAATMGAVARQGAFISFNGSTVTTTSGAAAATGQFGLRSTGAGSLISGTGATITLANTTGNSSSMAGLSAEGGGAIALTGATILVRGGTNGIGNHGVQALGGGSSVQLVGGSVTTQLSRGSFGVLALAGGTVGLSGGTQVAASGIQTTGTAPIASHALFATGAGSLITGQGIVAGAAGTLANGARAEEGGRLVLGNSTISTTGAGTIVNPAAALRAVTGGTLAVSGSTISASGQFGHGLSVEGAGSQAVLSNSSITVTGLRSNAISILDGGAVAATGSSVLATNALAIDVSGAGSTLALSDSAVRSSAATGAGIRVAAGGSAAVSGGSIVTELRDAPGLNASNGSATLSGVTITTLGPDNAMGVVADLGGQVTVTGGSVTTSGDSVRAGARAHGLVARNPGGTLVSTGTSVRTQGAEGMGVVADDGGSMTLTGNSITTLGTLGIGLFSVVEQVGAQFPAGITASNIAVETFGLRGYGAMAQQNFLAAPATIVLNDSSIVTHGESGIGLRALSAGTITANRSTVSTEGLAAHGVLVRDNGSSVTLNQSAVRATGTFAHGAVVEGGGLLTSNNSLVNATGNGAAALLTVGAPGNVPVANISGSVLGNLSGPTIGVAGPASITLSRSVVGGSGQWLLVGSSTDLPPLTQLEALSGVPDFDDPTPVPLPPPLTALPVTPGLATITVSNSVLSGSALTLPDSVSNVTLNSSLWNMTGSSNLTNLVNNGSVIAFSPPGGDLTALSNYKTLTVVSYAGQGGVLGLNTFLGGTGSPSDRLVIDSGMASGQSSLLIRRAAGGGALTVGDGILVVDTANGGTTAPGTFQLARRVVAGPYEYTLQRGGAANGQAWFLRSTVDCSATPQNPTCSGGGGGNAVDPSGNVPPGTAPNYRPEVSLFTAVPGTALLFGHRLLGTLHERMGDRFGTRLPGEPPSASGAAAAAASADAGCPSGETCGSFGELAWMRVIRFHGDRDGGRAGIYGAQGPSYQFDMTALQVGSDILRLENDKGRHHFGIFGAYGAANTGVTHATGLFAGNNVLNAYALGGYWTWYGTPGWYIDTVVQGIAYDFNVQPATQLPATRVGGLGLGASLEAGQPFDLGGGVRLEPQLQLVYQSISLNSINDGAAQIQFGNVRSLTGRAGARVARTWQAGDDEAPRAITGWMRASVWNEFLGRPVTSFSSDAGAVPFAGNTSGAWGEVNLGIDAQFARRASFYASASYLSSFSGDRRGYDGKIGVKFAW